MLFIDELMEKYFFMDVILNQAVFIDELKTGFYTRAPEGVFIGQFKRESL